MQETPEQPEKETRPIGRIFVEYRKGRSNRGTLSFGGLAGQKIPRLGYGEEEIPWMLILTFAGSVSLLAFWLVKRVWERKKKDGER